MMDFRRLLLYMVIFLSHHLTSRYECLATRIYCMQQTSSRVMIDFGEKLGSNLKFCPYGTVDKWSMQPRNCSWRVCISGLQPSGGHLAIERFDIQDPIHNLSHSVIEAMGNQFVQTVEVHLHNQVTRLSELWNGWNDSLNFQLLELSSHSDYVDISLQMNSPDKVNASNQFYLRIAYSTSTTCSRGFVMKHGSCFTVRTTDRMAQAAAFRSLDEAQGVLQNYTAASEEMGEDWHNTSMPMRLAMSHCGNGNLAHWLPHSNGTCSCGYLTISENRMLPGSGDCVAVLAGASADLRALKFQPVACAAAMPTVLSFPAVPPAVGAGHCMAADQLRKLCCNPAVNEQNVTAATSATTQNPKMSELSNMKCWLVVLAVVSVLLAAVAVVLCPSARRHLSDVALLRCLMKLLKPTAETMAGTRGETSPMNA